MEVSYKLLGKNRYRFVVAKADPSLPIVIDPILQATYLGGSSYDYAFALAIGPAPNYYVYVAGETSSPDFPRTSGGAQESNNGYSDAFVARLDSTLTNSSFQSTYLGGSGGDFAYAIAIHPTTGEVYVMGETNSNDFPGTSGRASSRTDQDTFVAKLTADLAAGASTYTLSISPTPTNGNVTSSPAGINCGSGGSTCSASFTSGSTVALTATPSTGYTFAGWTGDCSGCGTNTTCTINMTANKTCSANFTASGGGGGGGSGDGSGSGGGGGGSGGSGGTGGGGGGGCSTNGSASSMAGLWNILVWLSVPAFALARRIKRR